MNISFAETLRRLRLKNDISQQQLADLIHVQRSTIASWETGRRIPDVAMISQLSECPLMLIHFCTTPKNAINH